MARPPMMQPVGSLKTTSKPSPWQRLVAWFRRITSDPGLATAIGHYPLLTCDDDLNRVEPPASHDATSQQRIDAGEGRKPVAKRRRAKPAPKRKAARKRGAR